MPGNSPDRGAVAALRRSLTTTSHLAWAHLREIGCPPDDREGVLTAGLYAEHFKDRPMHSADAGNLGNTWRLVYNKRRKPNEQKPADPEQGRFRRLLACDLDEIEDQLVAVVRFAKAEGVMINYDLLERDLHYWGPDVQFRWACAFYQVKGEDEKPNHPNSTEEPTTTEAEHDAA